MKTNACRCGGCGRLMYEEPLAQLGMKITPIFSNTNPAPLL
jgi:hypothetical protein